MSGQSAKRQKTTPRETQEAGQAPGLGLEDGRPVETVKNQGLGHFEHVPAELLEIMLGSQDVRTLCSARLVCSPFKQAASRHLHSLRLSAEDIRGHPDTNLSSFPDVTSVTVSDVQHYDLWVLQRPKLSAAITNVSMTCQVTNHLDAPRRMQIEQWGRLPPLPPLPGLTSLTVLHYALESQPRGVFPTTLRELVFEQPVTAPTPQPLLGLTQLTFLRIAIHHDRNRPFDALTTLRGMQKLEIKSRWSFLPTLAKFPQLTHLVWTPYVDAFEQYNEGQQPSLAPLSRLQKLVHLGIVQCFTGLSQQDLTAIGKLTNLRSLDLLSVSGVLADGDAAVPAWRLTRLRVNCRNMAPLMRTVKMEELQDLMLANVSEEWLPTLARATGLTQLVFAGPKAACPGQGRLIPVPWFPTFGGMSRLQALTMQANLFPATSCAAVVGALTGLTRLAWVGRHITSDDVSACAALEQLRTCFLLPTQRAPGGALSPEAFMALAKRPQLTTLKLSKFLGITQKFLTVRVKAELNSERHRRGWPPLALSLNGNN